VEGESLPILRNRLNLQQSVSLGRGIDRVGILAEGQNELLTTAAIGI
jgi:hypothetical protein